jgi:hypothetical protein
MTGLSTSELSVEGDLRPAPAFGPDAAALSATASTKPGMKARNGGIDALRAAVTLLVVFHHTAITYGAIGGWYYREIAPSKSLGGILLILFCTINQAWFMGLFWQAITRPRPMTVMVRRASRASGCCASVFRFWSTSSFCIP